MKRALVGVCIVIVVVAAPVLAYVLWPEPRPEPPQLAEQTTDEITKYLASESFEELDEAQRKTYFDGAVAKFERGNVWRPPRADLTEEERARLRKNAGPLFRKVMETRIEKYFEMPEKEKTAYLDEMIDRFEEMRKARDERRKEREAAAAAAAEGEGEAANQPAAERPDAERRRHGRRGFTPERMRSMIENTPPETRARFVEFMLDMRARREERGLPAGRGPGGGRGARGR